MEFVAAMHWMKISSKFEQEHRVRAVETRNTISDARPGWMPSKVSDFSIDRNAEVLSMLVVDYFIPKQKLILFKSKFDFKQQLK